MPVADAWAVSRPLLQETAELVAFAAPSGSAHALVVVDVRTGQEVYRVDQELASGKDATGALIGATDIWLAVRLKGEQPQYRCFAPAFPAFSNLPSEQVRRGQP